MAGYGVAMARIGGQSSATQKSRIVYLEMFLVNSWAEHLRQHERQTQADRELEGRLYSYLSGEPKVRHLIDT
jgi:hypothetical protein